MARKTIVTPDTRTVVEPTEDPIEGTIDDGVTIEAVPMDRRADRIGHRGADFAWVAVKRIRIDRVYQRGLNTRRVNEIAENFDLDVFNVVTLSLRSDGSMWALDGQHRVAAIQTIYGHDSEIKVPAFIMRNLNEAGEARIFYKMNRKRLAPTAADGFKARLAFGDEVAVSIAAILKERGLAIKFAPGVMRYGEVQAIATCEDLYRVGMLPTVLDLIGDAWKGESGAHKATLMRGVYTFATVFHDELYGDDVGARLRDDRRRRLLDAMAALPPTEVEKRAKFYQNSIGAGAASAVARAIHAQFNRGLRGSIRLSSWGEDDDPGEAAE